MSLVKTNQLTNLEADGQVEVLKGLKVSSGEPLTLLGPVYTDANNTAPDAGKVLTSTVGGVQWTTPSDLNTEYTLSTVDDANNTNQKLIRLLDSDGVEQNVALAGSNSVTISRTSSGVLSFGLAQDLTATSDVAFNNIIANGALTIGSEINVVDETGVIKWDAEEVRWKFTNDGLTYYNFILPTETVYDAAAQYGASGDDNAYLVGSSQTVIIDSLEYLKITFDTDDDIQFFNLNQQVKIFGASTTANVNLPNWDQTSVDTKITIDASYEQAKFNSDDYAKKYYTYAFAAYNLDSGDVSAAYRIPNDKIVQNLEASEFDETNYNAITIERNDFDEGILIYRAVKDTLVSAQGAANSDFKLFAVLGPKEFSTAGTVNAISTIFNDYGEYDVPSWTTKNSDGTYKDNTLVHFSPTLSTTAKRGWATAPIKSITATNTDKSMVLDVSGLIIDTTHDVYVYHDDTSSLQTAINELSQDGTDFLILPGGTYLIDQLKIPNGFALRGLDDATVLKKQHWTSTNRSVSSMDGLKNSIFVPANYDADGDQTNWITKNFVLRDLVIDGNAKNQYLYGPAENTIGNEGNNSMLGFPNSEFLKLKDIKIRNTFGPALYATGSKNLTISGSNIFDGMETERYQTPCILASESENINISSTTFKNYPGAIDLTTSQVVSMNGSVIDNCGSGIQIYGSTNTAVLDNLILGPAGEFIPVPDIYDTDYDQVNLVVTKNSDSLTPVYQYEESGSAKDFTNSYINFTTHIANVSSGQEVVGNPISQTTFQRYQTGLDQTLGQLQFKLTAAHTVNFFTSQEMNGGTSSIQSGEYFVYKITASEFFTPTVDGLEIGSEVLPNFGSGISTSASTTYTITLSSGDAGNAAYGDLVESDYIKLYGHEASLTPSAVGSSPITLWKVVRKFEENFEKKIELSPHYENSTTGEPVAIQGTILTGAGIGETVGGGYYQKRRQYVIAKGVISRTY